LGRLRRELEDAATLGTALLAVPCTWWLIGWRWPRLVSAQDGVANLLILLQTLVESGGDWSRAAYRADLLGGMNLRDAVGPFPVLSLLARLGFGPTAILDITTILLQAVIAFLGVRAAADLAAAWSGREVRLGAWARLAGVWACAFAPALGWRLGAGHQTLVTGMLPFLAGFALLAAAGAGTASATLIAVCFGALTCGVLFTGHQMVVYGLIFGGPILLGLWWSRGGRPRDLALPAVAALGAFLVAFPELWGVFAHALGSDSLRTPTGMRITYSYLTAHPLDWLGSLPWTLAAIQPSRPTLLHHEINSPLGPTVLLLALVPWSRAFALGVGLGTSAAAAVLFSMNVRLVSNALIFLFPILGSFRVPTRAMLPALFVLPILALAGVLVQEEGRPRFKHAAALVAAALLLVAPSLVRELAGWSLVTLAILRPRRLGRWAALPAGAVFLVVAAGGLAAFRERVLSFPHAYADGDALLARAHAVAQAATRGQPALASMLVRVSPSSEWLPELLSNAAPAAGLSSLDGYYFPQRRFVELVCAVRGEKYKPNLLRLTLRPAFPGSRALFQLYNVAWQLDPERGLAPLVETAGPAWFSAGLTRTPSFAALGEELLAAGDGLALRAHRTAWLVSSDPMVARAGLPDTVDSRCAQASVYRVDAPRAAPSFDALVSVAADCPLTFAANYAETLRATASTADGSRRTLEVYPAYGALTGVWVPAGTTAVSVEAVVPTLPSSGVYRVVGAALLLWLLVQGPRRYGSAAG
jgi:hypothetical protein